jgi:outer membrane protein OmpA-like peptidoglycan-associated protein
MKAIPAIGLAIAALLVTVGTATHYFQPRLEKKLVSAALDRLQQDNLRVESVSAHWRKITVRIYGSNPAKLKQVYDRLTDMPGMSSLSIETLPVRDPFLSLDTSQGMPVVHGLLSNRLLAEEIAQWTGQTVPVAPDVREDPLEGTLLDLVQQWSQTKEVEGVQLAFKSGSLKLMARFNDFNDLITTADILRTQKEGVIERKLVLNKFPEPTASESRIVAEREGQNSDRQIASDGRTNLPRLHFSFASSNLSEESLAQIQSLVGLLKANPEMRVRVIGFTDDRGDERFNYFLSKQRAHQVATLLKDAGVAEDSIAIEGRGPRDFLADNSTLAGRKLNRRVEFALTRKG